MRAVLDIVIIVLDLYVWLLIASAILSWLIAFNVVNTRNQFVAAVAEFLFRNHRAGTGADPPVDARIWAGSTYRRSS
jgi:hypothetical protein